MKTKFKKIVSLLLISVLLLSAVPVTGFAADKTELASEGQCGEDMFWTFDSESGLLTVYGSGSMYSYTEDDAPFSSNTAIKSVVVSLGVSELDKGVFAFCPELTDVELPRGMKTIRANSFESCAKLSVIVLPSNLTKIEDEAFYDCQSLTEIELPATMRTIGDSAFESSGLTKIELPPRINEIGSQAFSDCSALTEALIYSQVSEISDKAFAYCEGLETVSFPEGLEIIGKAAFNGCDSLKEIYFGGSAEDWNNLSISTKNSPLLNAEIYYNCDGTHIHEYVGEVTTPATCDADGEITYTCYCGKSYTEAIPAAHVWSEWEYFSPEQDVLVCELCGEKQYRNKPAVGENTVISMNLIEENDEYALIGIALDSGSFSGLDLCVAPNPETMGKCEFFMETEYLESFSRAIKTQGEISTVSSSPRTGKLSFASTVPFTASEENFVYLKCYKLSTNTVNKNDFELTVSYCYNENEAPIKPTAVNNLPEAVYHYHSYIIIENVPATCTEDGHITYFCEECGDQYDEIIPAAHKLIHKRVEATETADGFEYDVCTECFDIFNYNVLEYQILIKGINGAVIDEDNGIIYGLSVNLTDISKYIEPLRDTVTVSADTEVIGTGTQITVSAGGKEIKSYTAVIFGDLNGDGWYDGTDVMPLKLICYGMLTKDDVSKAVWLASDINHDGEVDEIDVEILEDAGVLLAEVGQTLGTGDIMDTSSVYGEYLNLISQNPVTEEIPVEDTVETEQALTFIEKIFYIIKLLISILRFDLFIR